MSQGIKACVPWCRVVPNLWHVYIRPVGHNSTSQSPVVPQEGRGHAAALHDQHVCLAFDPFLGPVQGLLLQSESPW
jgi:hypothetical protein